MRRKHAPAHENHERWLVSYADFITLLFAFFVVMFATTQADKQKAKQVSESVREALEHGQLSAAISTAFGHGKQKAAPPAKPERPELSDTAAPRQPAASDLAKSMAALEQALAAELAAGKLSLRLERRGLVVSFRESAFFQSGDDAIAAGSLPAVAKIAAEVGKLPNPLRLEGHTDSVPIHNSRFRSNWELSTARAIAVMELLREQFAIAAARMSVGGYAEHAPVDTNDSAAGRAHNRRVDLVVLSAEAELNEPKPEGAGAAPGRKP